MGKASSPANSLNSMAFPSMTGKAAPGPKFPKPNTALPSVTIATVFCLIVRLYTSSGFSAIALHILPTPGV